MMISMFSWTSLKSTEMMTLLSSSTDGKILQSILSILDKYTKNGQGGHLHTLNASLFCQIHVHIGVRELNNMVLLLLFISISISISISIGIMVLQSVLFGRC